MFKFPINVPTNECLKKKCTKSDVVFRCLQILVASFDLGSQSQIISPRNSWTYYTSSNCVTRLSPAFHVRVCLRRNYFWPIICPALVSQARPSLASQTHFPKRGKGLVNCVYKPCPSALYSAPQSRCSILSHDALHHCFSSNSSLENSEREPEHFPRYYKDCKNTSRIVFRERAYPQQVIQEYII